MAEKNNNGRITNEKVYNMFSKVQVGLAKVEAKQEDMAEDVKSLFDTVNKHTEKIGIIRGKLMVWGVIGGGGVSLIIGIILLLSRNVLGGR